MAPKPLLLLSTLKLLRGLVDLGLWFSLCTDLFNVSLKGLVYLLTDFDKVFLLGLANLFVCIGEALLGDKERIESLNGEANLLFLDWKKLFPLLDRFTSTKEELRSLLVFASIKLEVERLKNFLNS